MELKNLAGKPKYIKKQEELLKELIQRNESRGFVENGRLISRPINEVSAADNRNNSWPGYHTEYIKHDIRH